ncbi:hypothetical protein GCM10022403_068790 [Streptomyces coacervatus]|uniref:Uncharacterized protein n=1 Tax=Streptomyces coacervatus TaxID=647381 RepID=A0ABP7IS87_9ACTN|nr:hypothetical protein [Streptomyces coacervatus]MDF2266700.1 hypothetical protein [Streptomyces coacervatus]
MSGPHPTPEAPPAPNAWGDPHRATASPQDAVTDVVRWAAFSCVLVPVVLLWYGTSLAGAAGTAFGLAAVTAVCRLLLRQSERVAARPPTEEQTSRRGRHHRSGTGAHRGRRHTGGSTPVG